MRHRNGFSPGTAGNPMLRGLVVLDLDAIEAAIFADGFASGDVSRWSASSG